MRPKPKRLRGAAKAATAAVLTATMAAGCATDMRYQPPHLPESEAMLIDFTEPFHHRLDIDHEKTKALSLEQRVELLNDLKRFRQQVERNWQKQDPGYKPEADKVLKRINEHIDVLLEQHMDAIEERYGPKPKGQPKKPFPKPEQTPPKKPKTKGSAIVQRPRAYQRRRV